MVLSSNRDVSSTQFTRPVFRRFLVDEKKTLALIQDIADLLESIAANPQHTPALYSTFLRALVTSQTMSHGSPRHDSDHRHSEQPGENGHVSNATGESTHNGSDAHFGFLGSNNDGTATPIGFPSTSEMGPVADMSTFPPTMAPTNSHDDTSGMLSVDSILSTGFWDSVLVPGS